MILVHGQDLDDYTPASKHLKKELVRAGFLLSTLEALDDPRDLASKGDCYVLSFGGEAFRELTGLSSITADHGMLHSSQWSEQALIFPTFATGYLYRNPQMTTTFRLDLELFRTVIKLDQTGVLD